MFVNPDKLSEWPMAIRSLLNERDRDQAAWALRRERARTRGARFSWKTYASRWRISMWSSPGPANETLTARAREAS